MAELEKKPVKIVETVLRDAHQSLIATSNMSKIVRPKGHVENNGFEPLTPCLQSRCSSQLS